MSYDASSLRGSLQRIDGSAPSIQGAAASMMKHYDKSPGVAVNCWRDMLARARSDQFLPLLYVANEVLQNSKRNRGNRFLEAFSPVLGQSLIYVCGKSAPPLVESIRRTVKIWAERRVFSIRYVNELLKGLEPYRAGGGRASSSNSSNRLGPPVFPGNEEEENNENNNDNDNDNAGRSSPGGSRFSPDPEPPQESRGSHGFGNNNAATSNKHNNNNKDDDDDENLFGDEPVTTNDNGDDGESDDDDDDVDDLFGNATTKRLQVDVDFDRASSTSQQRRPSDSHSGSGSGNHNSSSNNNSNNSGSNPSNKRRRSRTSDKQIAKRTQFLSTSSLLELMNKVSDATRAHESVLSELGDLRKRYGNGNDDTDNDNDTNNSNDAAIASLVGDELLAAYRTTLRDEERLLSCGRRLRSIAETRRGLELEALRYLPWLERALKQDGDDLALYGGTYRNQLAAFRAVHEPTRRARDRRLADEALRLRREEEERRKQREEEDRKKFMESAMSKQTEAQPGMVWNRATGEYQHLNQEESWRD